MTKLKINVNLDFDSQIKKHLIHLAEQERISISDMVKDLTIEALEYREDRYLSAIAEIRDISNVNKVKHRDVFED
ncbi:MAG: hypothetical protein Q7V63_10145 [Gammaproteobacteria bacterium]|nr:hypothetical protein [Gammaproteobacteria bacterium]